MSFQDLEKGLKWPAPPPRQQQRKGEESVAVEAGIFKIGTQLMTFDRLLRCLGTPRDTAELRDKLHKTRSQIVELIKETTAKLKEASESDHKSEDSPLKKINNAKFAKEFQSVLKEFQKLQRVAAEKETTYTPVVPKEALPSSYGAHELEIRSSKSPEQQALLVSRRQEVVFLDNEITLNEATIEEREQGIKEIQQQIGEVNEIFKDLSVLVREQGVMIDDIGSNVEKSYSSTKEGTSQLKKASKIQRANSSTKCLLLVIFGIILLICVIVVVA